MGLAMADPSQIGSSSAIEKIWPRIFYRTLFQSNYIWHSRPFLPWVENFGILHQRVNLLIKLQIWLF